MASSIQYVPLKERFFKNDPHWVKFKEIVSAHKTEEAAQFLFDSYRHKRIEEKLDQYLYELIDSQQPREILTLASAMRRAGRLTHLARIARLGAAILTKDPIRSITYRTPSTIQLARSLAPEYRARNWETRARFMDQIASS